MDQYSREQFMAKYGELLKQYYATIAEKGRAQGGLSRCWTRRRFLLVGNRRRRWPAWPAGPAVRESPASRTACPTAAPPRT